MGCQELQQIRRLVDSYKTWYHRIELAPGIVTPGTNDSPAVLRILDELGLPRNCKGLRVLDVGCRDGFFAFELERRGAAVIGMDYMLPTHTGFSIASQLLGSRVEYRVDNVYDIAPSQYGTFDIVLFLGILYHLRNPLLALDRVRSVAKPGALLFVETHLLDNYFLLADGTVTPMKAVSSKLSTVPLMQFYPGSALAGDDTNKWAPNMCCLRKMAEEAQFRPLRERILGPRGYLTAEAVADERRERYRALDSGRGF